MTTTRVRDENLYGRWNMMKQRCNNPNNEKYEHYGKRGIKVCEEWLDYNKFKEWSFENGFKENLTIDRINTNGNYEPSNCRWVNQKEQQNNRRNNRIIYYKGKEYTLEQLSENHGIKSSTVSLRLSKGLTLGESLKTEPSLRSICKEKDLPYKTIHARISRGWDFNKAINTPVRKGDYK